MSSGLLFRFPKSIKDNRVLDGKTILKFKAEYNVKPGDLAQLWCAVFLHSFLNPFQLFYFVGVPPLLTKMAISPGLHWIYFLNASGRKRPGNLPLTHPQYLTETFSPLYSVHVDDEISTDPSRNSAENGPRSPPFPVMKLDSHPSPISFPRCPTPYYSYTSCSPSSPNVVDYVPSDAISPTSPAPPINEPFSTIALGEIKVETATLIL
jgi:hypothetical protein